MSSGLFNALFSAFGKFFSRSFWLANFMPVAVVAAVHVLLASRVFPQQVDLAAWLQGGATNTITGLTVSAVALVVLAYSLSPFTPLLRGLLDGQLLPEALRDVLRRSRFQSAYAAESAEQAELARWKGFKDLHESGDLASAAKTGGTRPAPATGDVAPLAKEINPLRDTALSGRIPDLETARKAYSTLKGRLSISSSVERDEGSEALQVLWDDMLKTLEIAVGLSESRLRTLRTRRRIQGQVGATEATQVGDARHVTERYSETMYGADFNFIWPRMQLLLEETSEEQPTLEAASAQIEFAVMSLALSSTVPLVWLPLLGLYGADLTPVVILAIASPLVWLFFYQLVVESQIAFGGVVRAIIDRRHLDLLVANGLPRPDTISDERELWRRLQVGAEGSKPSLRWAAGEGGAR